MHTNKTLLAEVALSQASEDLEIVPLENHMDPKSSLILMTIDEPDTTFVPLFTHNYQIKHESSIIILDNDIQNNLVVQDLVQHLELPTMQHYVPY